jgi:TetR/AcrR family transcriptional regulator, transcriptional repressor for nem operon
VTEKTTRDLIVETADRLFYENGFDHTSFADIAGPVGISRGNFYYYFKTKDEILDSVIELRLARTAAMLAAWAADSDDPASRIGSFIDMLIANRAKIMAHGCPVGTLSSELAKLDHVARPRAGAIFILFRDWLGREFARLGHSAGAADALAMELLVRSQGVATLASAFRDETFIRSEVAQMHDWLAAQRPSPQLA